MPRTVLQFTQPSIIKIINTLNTPCYGFLGDQIFAQLRRTNSKVPNGNCNNRKHNEMYAT